MTHSRTVSLHDLIDATTRAQRRAADPTASAWVSANAGTGKTHVLTSRVLRLLLAGTKPERILCLTFTKAAAACAACVEARAGFDRGHSFGDQGWR